ncbi:MAG: ABC transporter permease, partial [Jatrophihabitantaceae bacterium]
DLEARASRVNGVTHAGTYWQVQPAGPVTGRQDGTAQDSGIDVYAASPGLLPAAQASLASGVPINSFHNNRAEPVALLGKSAAARLGITSLQYQPAVFIAGRAFTVIGILQDVPRLPALVLSVVIPDRTALRDFGLPQPADPARALVSTRIGAAQVVAAQLPTAISARLPGAFQASAPPDPHSLRSAVGSDVNSLFLLLAGVALVIGALGIANTTLVAILERTDEIGLRRALGARRSHILAQFLSEAGLLGTLGGLIGSSLAVLTVLGVSISRHWTAILSPITVFPAPLAGTAIGLLAGLYPSLRASSIEPAESLRR